ncbi:putative F-box protein At5g55150 [Tripterygium wilfordii]|uniref:putative F-box protein At5g55150 n=1 Tax=Tripterygium wilfordii TaxID=458696 RepID=UPI0018F83161|nr:putative F-box protein At5g55150 [Tripterygium wilfordii]
MENLPYELLYTVIEKQLISTDYWSDDYYISVSDYDTILSLAIVSNTWQSIVKPFYLKLKPMMPPLILLTHASHCYLFNIVREEFLAIQLPQLHRRWVRSCSHEWLLTITHDFPYQIRLLNPLSRASIRLPPMWNRFEGLEELKVTVSTSPSDPNCVILARHAEESKLAFCRPGDRTWTRLRPAQNRYSSAIFYKDQLYLIEYGTSDVLNLLRCIDLGRLVSITQKSIQKPERCLSVDTYLVDSSADLLLILKYNYWDDIKLSGMGCTYGYSCELSNPLFEVYKLQNRDWVEVDNVGENAIYLSPNCSVSMPATDMDECTANRIYFFDASGDETGYMTGVYHIKNRYVELAYQSSPSWTAPLSWFTPELRS